MLPAGFEPAIPLTKRPHTHDSDRAATGIGEANSETTQNKHKRRKALIPAGFETAIPDIK